MKINFQQLLTALVMATCLVFFLEAQPHITQTIVTTLKPEVDVFQTGSATYTLKSLPAPQGQIMVFVDGLLMLQGADYDVSGSTLRFTGTPTSQIDQPIIQVMYWTAE